MFRAIPALKAEVERGAVLAIKKVRAVHFQNVINSPNPQDQVGWDYMRGGAKNPNRLELRDDKGKKQAPEAIKPEARAAMVKSLFKTLSGEGAFPGLTISDEQVKKIDAENEKLPGKNLNGTKCFRQRMNE